MNVFARPAQRRLFGLVAALGYVSLVLLLDVARTQGWLSRSARVLLRDLHLVINPSGFDWFKFVTWLLVPLALTLISRQRVRLVLCGTRREWLGLAVVLVGSCAA